MRRFTCWTALLGVVAVATTAACGSGNVSLLGGDADESNGIGGSNGSGNHDSSGSSSNVSTPPPSPTEQSVLDARVVDYGEALRTASLKLVGALPPLADVKAMASAKDQKTLYEADVDKMMDDVRFQERVIKWWKDVFRMGDDEGRAQGMPSRETAPTFAARMIVEGHPFTDILTSTTNTCPTYDYGNHTFSDGTCSNGVPAISGVLTDPGVMYQYFSHMAFRRVRFIQEIFVCTKFPAEFAKEPTKEHGAEYTSPWPFKSVATAPINFQDTSSVVCADCHTSINHIAPLFGHFDDAGQYKSTIQVQTPTIPNPQTTQMTDWLAPGEKTHWRLDKPAADITALGEAMADDQDVADCAVTRAYNYAFSKGDAVTDLATVPDDVLEPYREEFQSNGMNVKEILRKLFKSTDFVKF